MDKQCIGVDFILTTDNDGLIIDYKNSIKERGEIFEWDEIEHILISRAKYDELKAEKVRLKEQLERAEGILSKVWVADYFNDK